MDCQNARSWSEIDAVELLGDLCDSWCPKCHYLMPQSFKRAAKTMLLVNLRLGAFSPEILHYILSLATCGWPVLEGERLGVSKLSQVWSCGQRSSNMWFCKGTDNGCKGGPVFGLGIFSLESNKCSAAAYSGLLPSGGFFRIIDLPGQETYFGGITRNNVSVLAHGPSSVSFVVSIGESINVPQLCGPCNVDTSSWFCRGHLGGCVGGLVYGTDAYALASNYCSAAQHSGAIDFNAGGKYSLVKLGRVPHFYGSIRNGISSLDAEGSHTGFLCTIPGSQPILPPGISLAPPPCGIRNGNLWCQGNKNGCPGGTVWGTDVYTSDSDRCRAALHAGIITDQGGYFSIDLVPGREAYQGSTRNGVTTYAYGPWAGSFIVNPPLQEGFISRTTASTCSQISETVFTCKGRAQGCAGGTVWGTGMYTSDSNKCAAALHSGVLGQTGGAFQVIVHPGLSSYVGSTQNGVTTLGYGQWPSSFSVIAYM